MPLVTQNVHRVTGSNSTIKVIIGPAENPRIAYQIITDLPPCSQEEPGIQDYGLPRAFSKHKPSLMLGIT
jgi:hypothetical protein